MTTIDPSVPHLSLPRLFLKFLRFGCLAFGGPVAQIAMVRQALVDEEMGVINVFCRFGGREEAPDSHTFRYIDGKFRLIHTLTPIPGPQANDEGGMVAGARDPNAS